MRWFRRPHRPAFDAAAEQRRIVEAVLRSATALVAADDDARQLISRHCETLTTLAPHIVLAWTWFGPPQPDRIQPQVVAGAASACARDMRIDNGWLTRLGPAYRTLAGRRLQPFAVSRRSLYGPWRRAAQDHGVRSVLALPLCSSVDDQRGLLVLYADVPGYFDLVGVSLFDALTGLFSAALSRAVRNAALAREVQRDALTGLANRRALTLLDPGARRLTAHDPPASVVLLDIDHFRHINDRLGHAAGDDAIRRVAQLLLATLCEGDTVVRWGGEAFVVWLPGLDSPRAQAVAEKLRLAVAGAPPPRMTVSIGMAELRVGETVNDAIARADRALHAARQAGRNRVVTSEALAA